MAKGNEEFQANLKQWYRFCSWSRFYPDLFLDLIKPEKGGINLHLDQRVFLRAIMRFVSVYGVFPRGWSKTAMEVLAGMLVCIFFPGISISISAQTQENASELLQSKYNEMTKFYPLLANEIASTRFSKGDAELKFINGSIYNVLANKQSSKGQRRARHTVEESALLNNELFQDVIEPIVNIGRCTVGTAAINDPCELNHQLNFFTTSGFRGSDEFQRNIKMIQDMVNLRGVLVFGAGWELACWYGRGLSKSAILKKREDMTSVAFAQNYESHWVGVADNALVDIRRLMKCRTLSRPMMSSNGEDDEIYLGVDVARSENAANNQSSISIIRVKRTLAGRVSKMELVNTIGVSNTLNFTAQAIYVKRYAARYKPRMVIVDGNGLIDSPLYQ